MFNLDQAIAAWRREATRSGLKNPEALDELEAHVREETQALIRTGKPEAEAYQAALERLGSLAVLGSEFKKLAPRHWWPVRAAQIITLIGAIAMGVLMLSRVVEGRQTSLLAAHVFCVTLGYGTMFILGALGICFVCARLFGGLAPAQGRSLRRSSLALVEIATISTGVGMLLGMIWTKENWGRYWGWDAKETGALLVWLWAGLMAGTKWLPSANEAALMRMALLGHVLTGWAWFGAATRNFAAYGYPSSTSWMVFVSLPGAFLLAGLLPAGCLRFRRRGAEGLH